MYLTHIFVKIVKMIHSLVFQFFHLYFQPPMTGADPGGGGGTRVRPPPPPLKNFWRIIVIFHTKYPKHFRASLRSAQFF